MTETAPEPLSFSVIVASKDRPEWLKRCVNALKQLDYPSFEIVVVADEATLNGIEDARIRRIRFDQANLSAARNLGVRHAGGQVCAFLDDDAVPEPLWLRHLHHALRSTEASAVVGFVRGRNGISFQSRLSSVDAESETHEEGVLGLAPVVPTLSEGRAVKLIGTNFAVRRDVLQKVGGFDENYRYFLEDSDLSMRLMKMGERVAVAPLAEVHHGFAPSPRRSGLRAPLDLFDIGRSTAIYLRTHLGTADGLLWERLERRERARLSKHLVRGTLEPRDMRARLDELNSGWKDGLTCPITRPWITLEDQTFQRFPAIPPGHDVLSSRLLWKRRGLVRRANAIAAKGGRVSVFSFSLTPVRHHVRYVGSGVWLQTGGVYGRSDRSDPRFRWCRFVDRLKAETARVAKARGIGKTDHGKWWDETRSDVHGQ